VINVRSSRPTPRSIDRVALIVLAVIGFVVG